VATERTVADLMSHPVVTAQPAETVALAAQRMRERRVGSVVVIDHDDRAIGILTERDMIRLTCLSLFWHFLDVVWIGVFTFVYLASVI